MPVTCAAAFNPKVWTCAAAPRGDPSHLLAGLPVPAPPCAQRGANLFPCQNRRKGRVGTNVCANVALPESDKIRQKSPQDTSNCHPGRL